jgi:hypothetical protein
LHPEPFHHPTLLHPQEKYGSQVEYAHDLYVLEADFSQVVKNYQILCQTIEKFSTFFAKSKK